MARRLLLLLHRQPWQHLLCTDSPRDASSLHLFNRYISTFRSASIAVDSFLPHRRRLHPNVRSYRISPPTISSSLLCVRSGLFKVSSIGQHKNLFIQTQSTPNPQSLMFLPGNPVMEQGSADFPNSRAGMSSPLAKSLFRIDGVTRIFFGSNFVTVTKSEESSWDILKPEVFAAIMDFYTSKQPLFYDSVTSSPSDTAIKEDDDEIVAMIKELIETRIRPAVQDDGGDIEYHGFDVETGIVKLRMQGACSGCPSSSVTLKSGIQNMLMHYVPEVKGVEEVKDEESEDVENKES